MTSKGYFKKICKNLNNYKYSDEFKKGKKVIEKELKALKIIKEKHIDCMLFIEKDFDSYDEYIEYMAFHNFCTKENIFEKCYGILTQEEFDLLKEVFSNDKR